MPNSKNQQTEVMNKPDQKTLNSTTALNRTYIAPEIARQRLRTIETLDIKRGENILDVGCGTGFLCHEMALIVGEEGNVLGIDPEPSMISATSERCGDLPQVSALKGEATAIPGNDGAFDVATCTQVLLYVEDVPRALAEIHRCLKPGGRVAVLETDWRGMVISSDDNALTRNITDAWDATVASPNLPPRLPTLLRRQGFRAVRGEAIPLLNTSLSPNSFSYSSISWLAKNAYKQGAISKQEGRDWTDSLRRKGDADEYFFCLNRFLFTAVK